MRVKGYKMYTGVYVKVLINGEIGFEKIMNVSTYLLYVCVCILYFRMRILGEFW